MGRAGVGHWNRDQLCGNAKGSPTLLATGVLLVVAAMIVFALAHRKMQRSRTNTRAGRGLVYALIAGLIMGQFYPQLAKAISPEFSSQPIQPGLLTP